MKNNMLLPHHLHRNNNYLPITLVTHLSLSDLLKVLDH